MKASSTRRLSRLYVLWFAALAMPACAATPPVVTAKAAPTKRASQAQIDMWRQVADQMFNELERREQVAPAILAYEQVLSVDPEDRHTLVRLSILHYFEADHILPKNDRKARVFAYKAGRDLGMKALQQNAEFRQMQSSKYGDLDDACDKLVKADVPALYWTAMNWARWGEMLGNTRGSLDTLKIRRMMERVNELDASYWWRGADRYLIEYFASASSPAERDIEKAKQAYERTMRWAPIYLDNQITYSLYYARETRDRGLWEALLRKVVSAPPDPSAFTFKLANTLARDEAKALLEQTPRVFASAQR